MYIRVCVCVCLSVFVTDYKENEKKEKETRATVAENKGGQCECRIIDSSNNNDSLCNAATVTNSK